MEPVHQSAFDRPLSAGGSALLHPGAFVVEFDLPREDVLEVQAEFDHWLAGQPGTTTSFDGLSIEAKEFVARHAHEDDHVNRLLSTSFGYLCDAIRCRWLTGVADEYRRAGGPCLPMRPPDLYPVPPADELLRQAMNGRSEWVEAFAPRLGNLSLMKAVTDDVTPAELILALAEVSGGRAEAMGRLLRGIDLVGGAFPLTARHLLEFSAIRRQGNTLLQMDAGLDDINRLIGSESGQYSAAVAAWRMAFPDSAPTDPDAGACGWGAAFPLELFVAVDLALWVPFLPSGRFRITPDTTWADLHPGRRFARVLGVLNGMGVRPLVTADPVTDERVRGVQREVCERLDWPTPEQLAGEWLTGLSDPTSPWRVLDGVSDYRVANARRLLAARLDRPARAVLNDWDPQSEGVDSVAGWLHRDRTGGRDLRPSDHRRPEWLTPFLVLAAGRHLAERGQPFFSSKFPAGLRRVAVHTLAARLAAASGWDAGVLTRFVGEAEGWCFPDG